MTAALKRLAGWFIAPAAEAERPVTARTVVASVTAVGVLGRGSAATVAATAIALTAARRARTRCALVCRWTGEEPRAAADGSALPAARALAGRLQARGLEARACGRLVAVDLPAAATEARAAIERAWAAAGEVPVTVLVAGARPAELDGVLGALDRLVVVPPPGAPAALEELAVTDAARVGRAATVLRVAPSPVARALARGGLIVPPALRGPVARVLEGRDA